MSENSKSLQDELDVVNIVTQESLEERIGQNVESMTNQKLLEQEENRLERSSNLYNKLLTKKKILQRKLDTATRISVKTKLREQIKDLSEELSDAQTDLNDINLRIKDLKQENTGNNKEDSTGRLPGESERDFLVRTGQITAFGTTTNFVLDESKVAKPLNESKKFAMTSEQLVENMITSDEENEQIPLSEKSDDEYMENESASSGSDDNSFVELEENELDTIISQPGQAKDDGDEFFYQKRLKNWTLQRSKDRENDPNPNLPEWLKPHPYLSDAKLDDKFKIPGEIFSLLFNYQKTCVQWLYELYQQKSGGIIGDEMGLGKTIQIIAFLASLHHSNLLDGPIIIVCPATVMKQWCSELHHWWPPFRSVILHSTGSGMTNKKEISEEELENLLINSDSDIISYEQLQNMSKIKSSMTTEKLLDSLIDKIVTDGHIIITTYVGLKIHADKLLKVKWSHAILDEGHKIRNPDSIISLTCKRLKTYNRIILSGTPIQNNLNELWSLFDFIYPGKLGTLPVFQQQFVQPINMGGYANASNIQVQTGYKCATALRDLISPYLLRRVKSDVAKDLPEKKEMVLFCKLTAYQKSKYLEFLNSKDLLQIQKGKRHILYGIDILRKICNHPDIIDRDILKNTPDYGNPKKSGKMQVVKQLLTLWHKQGCKTLLFTQSRQMLDILEKFINTDDDLQTLNYLRMDGTTNISKRQMLVDQFNNQNYDIFLLTTRVGGLGVNLTGANRIIIFDPDWNPSTDLQARERAWRIGQKREVSIYRLMVSGTIEEKIYHRQIFKQFLTNKILSDPRQKRFFKMNELHDLFTLGGDDGLANEEMIEEVEKHTDKLKQSVTEEGDDLQQVANITGVSKLESFFNGKEQKEKNSTEDDRLIEGLLGGNGNLENAMAHEQVVQSHTSSSKLVAREAEKLARDAVSALRKSKLKTKKYDIGVPTWTGRFGEAGKLIKKKGKNKKNASLSSSQVLNNIKNLQAEKSPEQSVEVKETDEITEKNTTILEKIQHFLSNCDNYFSPSADIITHLGIDFKDKNDIIKMRALLKTIAQFDRTKKGWLLNPEFHSS